MNNNDSTDINNTDDKEDKLQESVSNIIAHSPPSAESTSTDAICTIEDAASTTELAGSNKALASSDAEDTYLEYAESHLIDTHKPPLDEVKFSRAQWLQIYLIAAIFSNLYVLFFEGHFDIGFWKNWTIQLASSGFSNYTGDYPPLWSNWLYVVSQFYLHVQIPIENNILFKYVTQIPITICHLLLTYLIYKIVNTHSKNDTHFHAALALTVFNPAILFNGPVWGQIDVAPLIPLIAAIMAGVSTRHQIYTIPLFILAMLTKFQMIAFAPIMGILFFRSYKQHLIGILISIPIFLIAFMPNILAGNFVQAFKLPYIGSMSMFSAATMGAANIWIPIVGNLAPDNIVLFGLEGDSRLAKLLTVRHVGMISFSIVCLFVFLAGIRKLAAKKFEQNQEIAASDMFFYALICTTTFFTILPGMHERYLLPAAIIALAYFATSPAKPFYAIALTLISALNVTMQHGLRATAIWESLCWIMVAVFSYAMLEFFFGNTWTKLVKRTALILTSFRLLAVFVLIVTTTFTTYILYQRNNAHSITLADDQMLLTEIKPSYAAQDYGILQVNLNTAGNPLSMGHKRYANGFGTHANSKVIFTLPEHAKTLSFIAGLDSAVEVADVTFSVFGDGRLLWQSPIITRSEKAPQTTTIDINGIKKISLQVSAMGNIGSDHANWINPIITLSKQ